MAGTHLALVLSLTTSVALAEPCPAAVRVIGTDAVAEQVRELLRERKLPAPASGCEAARVRVSGQAGDVSVELEDAYGRKTTRRVTSVLTAATFVESWVRTDVTDSLFEVAPADPKPPLEPPRDTPPAAEPRPAPSPPSLAGRSSALVESSVAFDGSLWLGGTFTGCVMLGPVCTGGILRVMGDTRNAGEGERLNSKRLGAEVLVSASLPISLSSVTLAPGVALGLGWNRITSRYPPASAKEDPVDVDSGSPRTEAFLTASLHLDQGLALDGVVFAGWTPLAHTAPFSDDGVDLSGEPRGRVGLGLGLSYGTP